MQVHEKLKVLRMLKGWSQEKMAEKLNYSLSGYTKIERGETKLDMSKLQRIAKIFDIDLNSLLNLNEANVFNIAEYCANGINNNSHHYTIVLSETQCAHELEKAQLLLREHDKEIAYLKNENTQLKEMIDLLKTNAKTV